MNNNLNRKVESILSGMNRNDLQRLMSMTKNSGLANRLTEADKQKILNEFSKLDTNQVKRKLAGLNSNDLSKMSADDIVRKLRQL